VIEKKTITFIQILSYFTYPLLVLFREIVFLPKLELKLYTAHEIQFNVILCILKIIQNVNHAVANNSSRLRENNNDISIKLS
jgi:hypothetical protein